MLTRHLAEKSLFIILCLSTALSSSSLSAQSFQIRYQNTSGDSIRIISTAPALDGGLWLLGDIANNTDDNFNDAVVLRLDAQGGVLWSREYDAGTFQGINTIVGTQDGGFAIAGTSTTDYFNGYVARGDEDGDILWSTFLGSEGGLERGFELLATADGKFLFAGHASFTGVGPNIYLAQLDSGGTLEWGRTYSISGQEATAYDVREHPAGGYLVCGAVGELFNSDAYLLRVLTDGSPLFMARYDYDGLNNAGISTVVLDDGGAVMMQSTTLGDGIQDPQGLVLTRVDFNGEEVWSRLLQLDDGPVTIQLAGINLSFGGRALNLEQTPDGRLLMYLVADTDGAGDMRPALLKMNGDGTLDWARELGNEGWLQLSTFGAQPLAITSDGLYAAVYQNIFDGDAFELVRVEPEGQGLCLDPLQPNLEVVTVAREVVTPTVEPLDEQASFPTNPSGITFSAEPTNASALQLDLGPDTLLCAGATLLLDPDVGGGAAYAWQDGSTDSTLLITEAGTYAVTVTQGECSAEDEVEVSSLSASLDLGPDRVLCTGEVLTLQPAAVFEGDYSWANGVEGPELNVAEAGTYILEFTNACGTVRDTVLVEASQEPAVEIAGSAVLCSGDTAVFLAQGPEGLSVAWSDGAGQLLGEQPELALQPEDSTTLILTASDGCAEAADTLQLAVNAPPELASSSLSDASCEEDNGSISLSLQGGAPPYSFLWQSGTGTPFSSDGPQLEGLPAGNYSLTVTDQRGCEAVLSFELAAEGSPQLSAEVVPPTCSGLADGRITLAAQGGAVPYSYQWSREGLPLPDTSSMLEGATAGTYAVSLTDASGCRAALEEIVLESPSPWQLELFSEGPSCPGEADGRLEAEVEAGGQPPYLFQLSGGPQQEEGFYGGLASGNYTLNIQDALGCDTSLEVSLATLLPLRPILSASASRIELGEAVQLNLQGAENATSIAWQAEPALAFSCADCPEPVVSPTTNTTVIATISNDAGCLASDTLSIEVERNEKLYVPNAFSPNDDGRNDLFRVFPGPGLQRVLRMEIYDRWGGLVYESDARAPVWDGKSAGEKVPSGVYAFRLQLEWLDGRRTEESGELYLLR